MLNFSKVLFMTMMVFGTSVSLTSSTWIGMWMGLELNMISFIPLIYKYKVNSTYESCMIYFLIQSTGSILMLVSVLNNALAAISPYVASELFFTMLMISMLMKMGVPPFHFWLPEILNKMSWLNCMVLITWQKIAPLFILSFIVNNQLMPIIVLMAVLVGAIGGLNQTSIRKIVGYSSINHMGWMISCMKIDSNMWVTYFLFYSTLNGMLIYVFNHLNASHMNQFSNHEMKFSEKILITSLLMSLGGLPPFLGFLPKWMVIQSMIMDKSFFMLIVMLMTSLITLLYYIRLTSSIMLINSSTMKWMSFKSLKIQIVLTMMLINMSIPVLVAFSF
uniref:NADH-ubiquinone oxidoreductase chain 2 n=1 Tax=Polididus armatissimus TaxID=1524522 RepID=A0A9E8Y9J2_9HEMI|nr:NADH dehydrogenase subunit 2 [Polididus armatissimus]WAJ48468.1 NADH dehydrogenase subunit 2 [Polididus armatissimus]